MNSELNFIDVPAWPIKKNCDRSIFILKSDRRVELKPMHPYKQHFIRMAIYNRWAFEQLIKGLDEHIDDQNYRSDCGLFFRSIHGTLVHLLISSKLWFSRVHGQTSKLIHDVQIPFEINSYWSRSSAEWEDASTDRDGLSRQILDECHRWIIYVNELDVERLLNDETIEYFDTNGNRCERNLSEALDHIFNHHTHHRGQITAMMTRFGGQTVSPVLDLSAMPKDQFNRNSSN